MYNNRSITDFFKPFAYPRPPKRCREDDAEADSAAYQEPPSRSPRLAAAERTLPFHSSPPRSSQTSALTSLRSDDSTIPDLEDMEKSPESPIKAALESFGSNGPVLASSQRFTRNGEVMIRNSDDESDSDLSLDDIDDLLAARRKPVPHSSPPTEPDLPSVPLPTHTPARHNRRTGIVRSKRSGKAGCHLGMSPPKHKFSLDALVAQAEADDAIQAGIEKARRLIGASDERRMALESKINHGKGDSEIDTTLLTSIAKEHGEKEGKEDFIDKLMQAIERTEALERPETWSFFEKRPAHPTPESPEFPLINRQNSLYRVLSSSSDRQSSIVNGFLAEVAHRGHLPNEILQWILDASWIEPAESLRTAYLSILTNAGAWITPHLDQNMITSLFRRLGATDEALNTDRPIVPFLQMPTHGEQHTPDWAGLRNVLKLLAGVAEWIDASTRSHALCLLFRLALDASVTADRGNLEAIEDAIENLVTAMPHHSIEEELLTLTRTIYPLIASAPLRLQLLRSIPTFPPALALTRRRLALAFFFDSPSSLSAPPAKLISYKRIIARLRTPDFRISPQTDYAALAATISILDIGLDDGDPPSPPASPSLTPTSGPPLPLPIDDNPTSAPNAPQPPNPDVPSILDERLTALHTRHQLRTDRLAAIVKALFSQIVDTGASHMLRTEAKEVLETFHSRLLYAVRTQPRKKAMFFGVGGGEGTSGAGVGEFMRRFLEGGRRGVGQNAGQAGEATPG